MKLLGTTNAPKQVPEKIQWFQKWAVFCYSLVMPMHSEMMQGTNSGIRWKMFN
jgi:hypothetical protein